LFAITITFCKPIEFVFAFALDIILQQLMHHVELKIYKPGFMKKNGNIKILRYLPLLVFLSALGLQPSGYAEKRILICTSSGDCDGIQLAGEA
jgi:hypothetical protein